MNYGKRQAAKKQKKISSKSAMQGKRMGVRLFKAFLLCIVVVGVVGVIGGGLFVKKIIDNAPEISPSQVRPQGFTSIAYADDKATEIGRFVEEGSNRTYKTMDEIPKEMGDAFVAIEDERFYKHNGIDPQGIIRAAVVGLTSGSFSEGASTLTQQLIKNNVFPNFVNENTFYDRVQRKLQEQFLAIEIEKQMDKEEILEAYMNTINLGQNSLGVQSAAKRYFNKDVSELTLSECTVIAGIAQNPSALNPVTDPEANAKRREKVLGDMLAQGYIDQAAYDEAMADDVYSRIQTVNAAVQDASPYSYFVDALSEQVIQDLQDQCGFTETQAYTAVYSGGLTIHSTQNLAIQAICDEEMNNDANYPYLKEYGLDYALTVTRADGSIENYSSGHIKQYGWDVYGDSQGLVFSSEDAAYARIEEWKATIAQEGDTYMEVVNISPQPQASLTLMDQYTGQIKAMVGGRGPKTTSLSLNRAFTGSTRQPGSCFKVVAAYAPAIDTNNKTLATLIRDEKFTYEGGQEVKNWWGSSYKGDMTVRQAITQSANVCAVKTITDITPQVGFDYCEKLGITTMVESREIEGYGTVSDIMQSTALGGLTDGVYNYELCGAYATFANKGVYNRPILYTQVLDHDGNVLLDGTPDSHQAVSDSTAFLLTSAMRSVVEDPAGTGGMARLSNMPVAGKTGTSTDNDNNDKDLWFAGYTPYYTCTVWGGYDDNKPLNGLGNFHLQIWQAVMSRVHEGLEYKDFEMPSSVEQKTVCKYTGYLAVAGKCPTITEYFAKGSVPNTACPGHKGVIGSDGKDIGEAEEAKKKEEEEAKKKEEEEANKPETPTEPTNPDPGGGDTGGGDTGGGDTGGGDTGGGDTGGGDTGGGDTGGGDTGGGDTGGGDTGGGDAGGGEGTG